METSREEASVVKNDLRSLYSLEKLIEWKLFVLTVVKVVHFFSLLAREIN